MAHPLLFGIRSPDESRYRQMGEVTLLGAVSDGQGTVWVGSDGQETRLDHVTNTAGVFGVGKLHRLGQRVIWGYTGDTSFGERLRTHLETNSYRSWDFLESAAANYLRGLHMTHSQPGSDITGALLAGFVEGEERLVLIDPMGSVRHMEAAAFKGWGDEGVRVAWEVLERSQSPLDTEGRFRLLMETAAQGSRVPGTPGGVYGLDGPVSLWRIPREGDPEQVLGP